MSLRFKLCLSVWVAVVVGTMVHQRAAGGESELVPMPVPMVTRTSLPAADENPGLTPVPVGQPGADAPAGKPVADADSSSTVTPDQSRPEVAAPPSAAAPDAPSLPVPPAQFQPQPSHMPPHGVPPYGVQPPGMYPYPVPRFGIPIPPTPDEGWYIDIRPSAKTVIERHYPDLPNNEHTDAAEAPCEGCGHSQANSQRYLRVYSTIPFNRAEYDVNPSYRHDSTMEILTGNARHQTIVRHTSASSQPVTTYPRVPLYNMYNPYAYGYLRPALRLNYYRHFPSLNPYVNIWNLSGAY